MIHMNTVSNTWKLIISILICELSGFTSGLIGSANNNTWFDNLNKPSWNPPSWLFAPVWGLLYFLMGISLWLIWKSNVDHNKKRNAIILFGFQLLFNFLWSILFFRFESPALAFVDIVLLALFILICIFRFYPINRSAAWLLVPYILWVCFAAFLNYTIWKLN